MIEQFQHKLTTSFFLWFDNFLLTKGQAFYLVSPNFYYYLDERMQGNYAGIGTTEPYGVYGSPYKQWVNDSSVSSNVPTGVYINSDFSGRADGIVLDFDNGRILTSGNTAGIGTTASVVGTDIPVKDFNLYMTNDTEEDLIVENRYVSNSVLPGAPSTQAIAPYDDVIPACFLSVSDAENKPLAFGGMQDTVVHAKAVVLTNDTFQLDGVLSIFTDSVNEVFSPIPMSGYPTTELGDLKNDYYNYTGLANEYAGETKFFIDKVRTSKLTDRVRKSLANDMYVGFIDFDIQQHRYRFS